MKENKTKQKQSGRRLHDILNVILNILIVTFSTDLKKNKNRRRVRRRTGWDDDGVKNTK